MPQPPGGLTHERFTSAPDTVAARPVGVPGAPVAAGGGAELGGDVEVEPPMSTTAAVEYAPSPFWLYAATV